MQFSNVMVSTVTLMVAAGLYGQEARAADPAVPASAAPEAGEPHAADNSSGMIEEIMVTARKQNESLLQTPNSVSAVTGAQLQTLGLTSAMAISQRIPNIYLDRTGTVPHVAIRGLANVSTAVAVDPAVGYAVDEVFLGTPKWISVGQFDLQQMEVLRGPQGVYFGKNTTAGLINVTTKGPTDVLDGYIRGGHEFTTNEWLGEGAIGGPLSDTLGARLAVQYRDSEGFITNPHFTSKEPAEKSAIVRGSLKWEPTSDLTIRLMGQYAKDDVVGYPGELYNCSPALVATLKAFGSKEDCKFNRRNSAEGSIPGYYRQFPRAGTYITTQLVSLRADWKLGDYVLSSVSGYSDINAENQADFSDSDLQFFTFDRPTEHTKAYSQELRLLSPRGETIEYLLGLYYYDAKLFVDDEQAWNTSAIFPTRIIKGTRVRTFSQDNQTYAGFGEITWNISSSVRLLAGGRYTEDRKAAAIRQILGSLGNPGDNNSIGFNLLGADAYSAAGKRRAINFSPSITAQWDFNQNGQIYASYKKGFKSGGFDSSLPRSTLVNHFPFNNEHVETVELGAKTRLFDGRVQMTASLFDSRYRDLQTSAIIPPFINVTLNAASAITKGAEFEMEAALTPNLTANLAIGYVDATYGSFKNSPCWSGQPASAGCKPTTNTQDVSGKALPIAPRWEISGGLDWQQPLGDYLLGAGIDASYRTKVWIANDFDPLELQKAVFLANARVSISTSDEKWTAALIGRNLLDTDYSVGGFPVPFFTRSIYHLHGDPRTVQFQVSHRF